MNERGCVRERDLRGITPPDKRQQRQARPPTPTPLRRPAGSTAAAGGGARGLRCYVRRMQFPFP